MIFGVNERIYHGTEKKHLRKLIQWKEQDTGRVLETAGGQTGRENLYFEKIRRRIFSEDGYINMADISGQNFLNACLRLQHGNRENHGLRNCFRKLCICMTVNLRMIKIRLLL